MHISNLLLPLLTITISSPVISAARVPVHGNAKRSPHPIPDLEKIRREGTNNMQAREGLQTSKKSKGKRLVRKKRATCQVHLPGNSTSASPSSAASSTTSSSTTAIGDNNWATPSSSSSYSSSSTAASSTTSSAAASSKPSSTSDWTLVQDISGNSFFDAWNFWSYDDPTHGLVDYVAAGEAWDRGLISINSQGHAIMKVDTTQTASGRGRKSVRIHGNRVFTGGMVLMDAVHMPYGCGTWPAWWQNGPNWPNGGEIDILEGVNDFTENQVSLHTGDGCTMPSWMDGAQTGALTTGSYDSHNCASYATSNQGCGVRQEKDNTSYGKGFNTVNGGVYAMVWDKKGIRVWFFPRASIPSDITNEVPDPDLWGTPVAYFPSDNCSPYKYFYDNFNIFDTTLCGDWAGADGVWNYAGYAGQSQSCAATTGYSKCSDYVWNQGSAFADAYWEVSYVKYFNSTSQV